MGELIILSIRLLVTKLLSEPDEHHGSHGSLHVDPRELGPFKLHRRGANEYNRTPVRRTCRSDPGDCRAGAKPCRNTRITRFPDGIRATARDLVYLDRRGMLKVSMAGLAGLTLPGLLAERARMTFPPH